MSAGFGGQVPEHRAFNSEHQFGMFGIVRKNLRAVGEQSAFGNEIEGYTHLGLPARAGSVLRTVR